MSAKGMYYHFFRKDRAAKGLPIIVPRPPGLSAFGIRSKRKEQYVVKLFKPIESISGRNWNVYQLKIGEINQSISKYMKSERLYNACFISGWDPYENPYGDIPNAIHHQRLRTYLANEGLVHVEAKTTGVDHVGFYEGERPCFAIFNISKEKADQIADHFYQNAYVRIPNPMGYLKLEIRLPVQKTYSDWKTQWVESFQGMAHEAARRLSLDSATEIMSAPESEGLHWLLPELRDVNKPWPMATPAGDQKGAGTEWDRLSKLYKAANWEINCALTPIDSGSCHEPGDD
jgi:hypothetical protein